MVGDRQARTSGATGDAGVRLLGDTGVIRTGAAELCTRGASFAPVADRLVAIKTEG